MSFSVNENNVLYEYKGSDAIVKVPEGVKFISLYVFNKNESIIEIILPDSIEKLSYANIENCPNLKTISIPDNVTLRMGFVSNCPNLTTLIFRGEHYKGFPGSIEDCRKCNQVIISEKGMLANVEESRDNKAFWEHFSAKTRFFNHEQVRMLTPKEQDIKIVKERLSNQDNSTDKKYVEANVWIINKKINLGKLVGSADLATKDKIHFILYSYAKQMATLPAYHAATYKTDIVPVSISEEADAIADTIDKDLLMNAIKQKPAKFSASNWNTMKGVSCPVLGDMKKKLGGRDVFEGKKFENLEFLLPLCRYADSEDIAKLITSAEYMIKVLGAQGRKAAIVIRSALLLSDTKEAVEYLKEYGQIKLYAEIRKKTIEEIEKSVK